MTVSQWADAHRIVTGETSPNPGPWDTGLTPYLREPMDSMSDMDPIRRSVLMWGAQLGKTEGLLNAIGYSIHHAPGPMMIVQPTVDVASNFSKERLTPLFNATPELATRVLENRSRDGDNTILVKRFRGGFLKTSGANSAASLRSTPIRRLLCDEVDAYPLDVDGEGDPLDLAEKRASNFSRGKIVITSTPKEKGSSRVEKEFLKSDQRRYFVPCPHCGHFDYMRFPMLQYSREDPDAAALLCGACGVLIEERYKTQMLAGGEWRSTAPEGKWDRQTRGYHLNALYSPLGWLAWGTIVREWLEAQEDRTKLKVFINTRLAETWEEQLEKAVDADVLLERASAYATAIPDGVGVLTASVDTQDDRLEYVVKGYGVGEESWLIEWGQLQGDPAQEKVWEDLDRVLTQPREHPCGQAMAIECTAVDTGGHRTEHVYRFCAARRDRNVFAIRGGQTRGEPLVGRFTKTNAYRARLYTLCVDTGKETVYARLQRESAGPTCMHFPEWATREYFAQLTAEKAVWKWVNGRTVRTWKKVPAHARNEALDLEVYALAALRILLGPNPGAELARRAGELTARLAGQAPAPATPAGDSGLTSTAPGETPAAPARPPRSSWVYGKGWRR